MQQELDFQVAADRATKTQGYTLGAISHHSFEKLRIHTCEKLSEEAA